MVAALNEHGVPEALPEIAVGARIRVLRNDAHVPMHSEGVVWRRVEETGAYLCLVEDGGERRRVSLLRDQIEQVWPESGRATSNAERLALARSAKAAKAAAEKAGPDGTADRPVAAGRGPERHQDERRAAPAAPAAAVAGAAGAGDPETAGAVRRADAAGDPGRALVPGQVAADRGDGTGAGGGPAGGAAAVEPAAAAGNRGSADPPAPTPLGEARAHRAGIEAARRQLAAVPSHAGGDAELAAFEAALRERFEAMVALLVAKRRSYGPHNLVRFGSIGIVIRASDKIDRLATMHANGAAASADGDAAEDAWMDLVGYGVLGWLHHDGRLVDPEGGRR